WDQIAQRFGAGVETEGTVLRLLDDGVVVDLGDDIEGFVPRSQVPVPAVKDLSTALREGQRMALKVIECDTTNRRIVLAVTQMPEPAVAAPESGAEAAAAPAGEAASAPAEEAAATGEAEAAAEP